MPISRKQFELGVDTATIDWMKRIHSFLAENKDKAYRLDEIRQHFGIDLFSVAGQADFTIVIEALGKLIELQAISSQIIRGDPYYCYAGALPEISAF